MSVGDIKHPLSARPRRAGRARDHLMALRGKLPPLLDRLQRPPGLLRPEHLRPDVAALLRLPGQLPLPTS